jgi:hypothetical protein
VLSIFSPKNGITLKTQCTVVVEWLIRSESDQNMLQFVGNWWNTTLQQCYGLLSSVEGHRLPTNRD